MLIRVLLITMSGVAFGLHQDLEMQAVQMKDEHLSLIDVPIQRELSAIEKNILNCAVKKYPHTFIEESYKLLTRDYSSMRRLLPEIEASTKKQHPFSWGMDQTFYSLTTYQMLYVGGMIACAFATHQDPAVITIGLMLETLLIGCMIAKHLSVSKRDRLLQEHVQLLRSCCDALHEATQTEKERHATIEYSIDQALSQYHTALHNAQIHRKLLKQDGLKPLATLEQDYQMMISNLEHTQQDTQTSENRLSQDQKNELFEAVRSCNSFKIHGLLKDVVSNASADVVQELSRGIYQNPARIQACYHGRMRNHMITYSPRVLLMLVFGLFSNVRTNVYFYQNYQYSILPYLMATHMFSLLLEFAEIGYSTGDSLDAKGDKYTLAMYQLHAKACAMIAQNRSYLSKTLSHKRSQSLADDCEYQKEHASLKDMLDTIKKDHAGLLTRIAD